MLKSLLFISLATLSFSNDIISSNTFIKDFPFCENDILEEHRTVNFAEHQDTSKKVYLLKKYLSSSNEKQLKKLTNMTVLSYGNGSRDYFIFVDPECKYCRAFAKDSLEHLDDVTYHIILFPLKKHKSAVKMMSFILDGKNNVDRFNRYKSVLIDETFDSSSFVKPSKKSLNYEQDILRLASSENIRSTPSFFKIDPSFVSKINWSSFNEEVSK